MATTGIDICSPYRMACTECNDLLVAPRWSAYVSKREVRHIWSCENCGHEVEMTVNPHVTQPAYGATKHDDRFSAGSRRHDANASGKTLACFRSSVSKPSVNQP
jgi:transcription elongation factor Elf1